jgi:hypothetical protein
MRLLLIAGCREVLPKRQSKPIPFCEFFVLARHAVWHNHHSHSHRAHRPPAIPRARPRFSAACSRRRCRRSVLVQATYARSLFPLSRPFLSSSPCPNSAQVRSTASLVVTRTAAWSGEGAQAPNVAAFPLNSIAGTSFCSTPINSPRTFFFSAAGSAVCEPVA